MAATPALSAIRDVHASCQRVWDVLADGWTYSQWVVGNSRTRAVDSNWPEPGAAIRHSIGVWPLVIDDQTSVEQCEPQHELVLRAGLGMLGAARITMRLQEIPDGCRVEMIEVPAEGPVRVVPDSLTLVAIYARNRECILRLAALAERLDPSQVK
ncbi:polyketide cyclase [Mycobacterium sp. MFM001]|uniref:SRPBCC domain-containing protein n=1 Tax=Mycobacterium sp. MFM001 TaxID=2049453 RepID=UPI000DA48B35|nr:SRPBCC domain-containing protein [Mycobacterium sp. MFM001]GBE64806.1 polyketide cyclase [Mycobacterium sp. MFM001]